MAPQETINSELPGDWTSAVFQPGRLAASRSRALCVDVDGTLLRTDLFLEGCLKLLKQNPLNLVKLVSWLMQGKAHCKQEVASRVEFDVKTLPYSTEVVSWLEREHAAGRRIVLATASDRSWAEKIAAHLQLFSDVLASDGKANLKGKAKLEAIRKLVGNEAFDYAGNGHADLPIFTAANRVVLVDPEPGVEARARRVADVEAVLISRTGTLRSYLRALRPHQWLKNALVFVPLLLAHKVFELEAITKSLLAFVCFCLCASAAYVLNDLLDVNEDRRHQTKRKRPFAAGDLPIAHGLAMVPALLLAAVPIALLLPAEFVGVLIAYFAGTLAYSFCLKGMLLFDVITLGGLYTVRIIAGSMALAIPSSFWLLAFSMFAFFSLALVKRHVELSQTGEATTRKESGRGYRLEDKPMLAQLGIASGMVSVLVIAFYIDSSAVKVLYRHPQVLWLICPLVLYLVCRIWILAGRNQMHDDPIVFAIWDWRSQIMIGAIGALLVLGAI